MTLYLQEELFSLDHFDIWDEDGNVKYQVERELFQFGRKLVVADMQGREVCFVQHIPFSIPCAYELAVPGGSVQLDRHFSFFTQQYTIDELGWKVAGSFMSLDFEITQGDRRVAREGFGGVVCVEAGGPTPGLGCAGRGIIAALEKLEEKGAYEAFRPDVVFYDVLGDVVCGGFSMPMRAGYADRVFIVTSGENMALHAAANIAMAVENFRGRGYASLGGLILNRRNVKNEEEKVVELAGDISSQIVGSLSLSDTVHQAEELSQTVIEAFPDSPMAAEYRALAENVLRACEVGVC